MYVCKDRAFTFKKSSLKFGSKFYLFLRKQRAAVYKESRDKRSSSRIGFSDDSRSVHLLVPALTRIKTLVYRSSVIFK